MTVENNKKTLVRGLDHFQTSVSKVKYQHFIFLITFWWTFEGKKINIFISTCKQMF